MQTVRTVSFPDQQLLDDLSPLPEGLRGVVWDLETDPDGGTLAGIDAVILPYINAGAVLGSLAKVPGLKFVQTQSTGFDGVIRLFDADSAVTSANTVGSPPAASATLIAIGTITIVAPTWLITSAKAVVSSPTSTWITHSGRPSGSCSIVWAWCR